MLGSKPIITRIMIRLAAVAVTSVYLLSTLMVVVHPLTVEHATCPEHGEFVHVDVGHEAQDYAAVDEQSYDVAVYAVLEHDEHHHCTLLTFFNQDTTLSAEHTSGWERSVQLFQRHSWLPDSPVPLSIPIYLVAPKTSPPALT